MKFIVPGGRAALFLCAALAWSGGPARAADEPLLSERAASLIPDMGPGHWRLALSPFSHHFRYNPDHRYVWAVGIERQRDDDWLAGTSFFRNSFGQPSSYTYVGKRFPELWGQPKLFGQLSAGMLYGYRGTWQHKVPLNYRGFSPGALASMGWQFNREYAATLHLLGDAGVMIQLSLDLR